MLLVINSLGGGHTNAHTHTHMHACIHSCTHAHTHTHRRPHRNNLKKPGVYQPAASAPGLKKTSPALILDLSTLHSIIKLSYLLAYVQLT